MAGEVDQLLGAAEPSTVVMSTGVIGGGSVHGVTIACAVWVNYEANDVGCRYTKFWKAFPKHIGFSDLTTSCWN